MPSAPQGFAGAVPGGPRRWFFFPVAANHERVRAAIQEAEVLLGELRLRPDLPPAAAAQRELLGATLARARTEAERSWLGVVPWPNYHGAWDAVQSFHRLRLAWLTPDQLATVWRTVSAEAEAKLDRWRLEAKRATVEAARAAQRPASAAEVEEVMRLLHERSQQIYFKINRLDGQLVTLAAVLAVAILTVNVAAWQGLFLWLENVDETLGLRVLGATLTGSLGGVLSLAFSTTRVDPSQRIPEVRLSWSIALCRPLVGATAAFVVMAFFLSGLVQIGGNDAPGWGMLAACFLAGFSERWFLGMVERGGGADGETRSAGAAGKADRKREQP